MSNVTTIQLDKTVVQSLKDVRDFQMNPKLIWKSRTRHPRFQCCY